MAKSKLPRGAMHQLGRLHLRHAGSVRNVAWSRRGDLIASVGFDEALILWRAATGELVHRLGTQDGFVTALGFSPDGARVASGKKTVRVWDCDSGKPLLSLKGHKDTVNALDFSPDGGTLATACDDHFVRFFDASTGAERDRWRFGDQAMFVRFSPDGQHVLVASEGGTLLHTRDGTRVASAPVSGWRDMLRAVFSPDGREVFVAAHDGGELHRLAAPSLETLATVDLDHGLRAVDVSPDGRWLAFAGFGRYPSSPHPEQIPGRSVHSTYVSLWDIAAWRERARFKGHVELVEGLAFSPDSARLASGSGDNTLRVWSVPDGAVAVAPGPGSEEEPRGCSFFADGRVAIASTSETLVWSALGGEVVAAARDAGHQTVVARGDGGLYGLHHARPERWEVSGATLARTWRPDDAGSHLRAMAVSPDGASVYTGDDVGALLRWRVGEAAPLATRALCDKELTALAVSPDGRRVAAGSTYRPTWWLLGDDLGGEAVSCEVPDRGEAKQYREHLRYVVSLAFSPDGARVFAATVGGAIEVFDAATGAHLRTIDSRARGPIWSYGGMCSTCLAVSPDGRLVATCYRSRGDHRVMLLSADDGAELASASGHAGPVIALAFSADGATLASVSGEAREAYVWEVAKLLPKG